MLYFKEREMVQYAVIQQHLDKKLSEKEAAERLGIHRSTLWRKGQRVRAQGPIGLVHKLRGRPSNNQRAIQLRKAICRLFETGYKPYGFRVAHFYQEAHQEFPESVSYPTVLRWLKEEKLVKPSRKGVKHRARRPRREAFGELIQMDTSIHDWLEWGKNIALISNIDDATNHICGAYLTYSDTTLGNMSVLKKTMEGYGLFASLYVDKSPIFKVTRTGGRGRINQPTYQTSYVTQVEQALEKLGIELIWAHSPQAKGRIERGYGTWQSRLIPELRKNGIKTLDKANAYIHEVYIPKHNDRFAQDIRKYPSAFVPLYDIDLNFILAEKYKLTISNDHIVKSKKAGLSLRILPSTHRYSYAKAKVDVFKHTDGSVSVLYKDKPLNFEPYV